MAAKLPTLTTDDFIDLVHGRFDQTNLSDLQHAFLQFVHSGKKHLAVYFHGGLVDRHDALDTAAKLITGYRTRAYPFFFVWNSDFLTTVQARLSPFASDMVIHRVVEQHIVFISDEMLRMQGLSEAQRKTLVDIANLPRGDLPLSLDALAELGRIVDVIWAQRPGGATLPPLEDRIRAIEAFEKALAADSTLEALGRWLNQRRRFTAKVGIGIARRVWERFRTGHDHGLYTTLIEEIAIAIKLDVMLAGVWELMNGDIDYAFRGDKTKDGGTAFLDCLANAWQKGMRVTLIAHSAGSVYVNRVLNAIADDKRLSDLKVDFVFLAAALSFDTFAETIDEGVFGDHVNTYRFFGLSDEREGGYWQVPGVYDKSLLYLVSALCERDFYADKPLVGMQRYWCGKAPYDTPNILTVTRTITPPRERVWSPTEGGAPPGYRSLAKKHQKFALETETNDSVLEFLK
jgi:hypothetical protein